MQLNSYILEILKFLASIGNPTINRQLRKTGSSYKLYLDNNNFIGINEKSISINNQDIQRKITLPNTYLTKIIMPNSINNFIAHISKNINEINHFGISYSCADVSKKLCYYKQIISDTSLQLFEEISSSKYEKWFFVGNFNTDKNPLFEIVLTESAFTLNNLWLPHFQIDLNTSLNFSEILKATDTLLALNFTKWNLNIPSVGTVLTTGILGRINGTKITLGIGTNLRRRQTLIKI